MKLRTKEKFCFSPNDNQLIRNLDQLILENSVWIQNLEKKSPAHWNAEDLLQRDLFISTTTTHWLIFKDQDHQSAYMLHKYTTRARMVWCKFTTFQEVSYLESGEVDHVLTSRPHGHKRLKNVDFMDRNVNLCSLDWQLMFHYWKMVL